MGNKGFSRQNQNSLASLYRLFDLVLIAAALWLAAFSYGVELTNDYWLVCFVSLVAYLYLSTVFSLYRSWRVDKLIHLLSTTFWVWLISYVSVIFILFLVKESETYSRVTFGLWFVYATLLLTGWRLAFNSYLRYMRKQGRNLRHVAILGVTEQGLALLQEINEHPEHGLQVAGFYDDRAERFYRTPFSTLGKLNDAVAAARQRELDIVYIALPLTDKARISNILEQFGDTTVDVHLVPDSFTLNLMFSRVAQIGQMNTISAFESPHLGSYGAIKRLIDVVFSVLILSIIAIPMLFIALAIKLTSPGPVIFKQQRYGLDGKPIEVWKFRSMCVMENGDKVIQATKNDPRVTPLGAFLRRTSLDELPQFFNVLKGDMSIVGPRPHAVAHNEEYRQKINFYMLRHKVKPGITGWAQINGYRGETETLDKMQKRIDHDLEYIRTWSPFFDIKIITLTIWKGFYGSKVY
jgi:putative colanic acid biosynthesis UDP-glucose lipid carrier transferase